MLHSVRRCFPTVQIEPRRGHSPASECCRFRSSDCATTDQPRRSATCPRERAALRGAPGADRHRRLRRIQRLTGRADRIRMEYAAAVVQERDKGGVERIWKLAHGQWRCSASACRCRTLNIVAAARRGMAGRAPASVDAVSCNLQQGRHGEWPASRRQDTRDILPAGRAYFRRTRKASKLRLRPCSRGHQLVHRRNRTRRLRRHTDAFPAQTTLIERGVVQNDAAPRQRVGAPFAPGPPDVGRHGPWAKVERHEVHELAVGQKQLGMSQTAHPVCFSMFQPLSHRAMLPRRS